MVKIFQSDEKVLREKAKEVKLSEIGSTKIKTLLRKMKEGLNEQNDGVAIAAPQIGESFRIFIVSGRAFDIENGVYDEKAKRPKAADLVCINPVLLKLSRHKDDMDEGCLSVRYLYGKVKRSRKASLAAYDENGKKFVRGASGLLAQIFQHETDHLDGILFIDKAKDVVDLPPNLEDRKKMKMRIKNAK